LFSPAAAWADFSSFDRAAKLEAAGKFEAALAAFEAMPDRSAAVLMHLGQCKQRVGRLLDAQRDFRVVSADPLADQVQKDSAEAALREIDQKIPRLRIGSKASDLVTTLDGASVAMPGVFRVDPGEHVVRATRAGVQVFERRLVVAEGDSPEIVVDVPSAGSAPAQPAVSAGPTFRFDHNTGPVAVATGPNATIDQSTVATGPNATIDQSTHNHFAVRDRFARASPFVVGAGIFAVAGVAFHLFREAEVRSVSDNCATQHSFTCDTDAAGAGKVNTLSTLTKVAFIGAGAALVAGGVLFALPIASAASKEGKPRAIIGPTLGGLVMRGTF